MVDAWNRRIIRALERKEREVGLTETERLTLEHHKNKVVEDYLAYDPAQQPYNDDDI